MKPPSVRLRLGAVEVDGLTFEESLDAIGELVRSRQGGTVFTPNVDHVVLAEHDPAFRAAYAAATLRLPDGMPVLWASRLLRAPLPEKVSGSDLVMPLMHRAAREKWRVYILGGGPGVAEAAAERLLERFPGLIVAGTAAPRIDMGAPPPSRAAVVESVRAARPDLVLVALGAPKQELWMAESAPLLRPAVLLGVGAAIDFIAGTVRRAPPWMSDNGLEWLYRLGREPRRMWRRYLVRDPEFLLIVLRELRRSRARARATRAG